MVERPLSARVARLGPRAWRFERVDTTPRVTYGVLQQGCLVRVFATHVVESALGHFAQACDGFEREPDVSPHILELDGDVLLQTGEVLSDLPELPIDVCELLMDFRELLIDLRKTLIDVREAPVEPLLECRHVVRELLPHHLVGQLLSSSFALRATAGQVLLRSSSYGGTSRPFCARIAVCAQEDRCRRRARV